MSQLPPVSGFSVVVNNPPQVGLRPLWCRASFVHFVPMPLPMPSVVWVNNRIYTVSLMFGNFRLHDLNPESIPCCHYGAKFEELQTHAALFECHIFKMCHQTTEPSDVKLHIKVVPKSDVIVPADMLIRNLVFIGHQLLVNPRTIDIETDLTTELQNATEEEIEENIARRFERLQFHRMMPRLRQWLEILTNPPPPASQTFVSE
jgi:hypothetical protein